MAFRSFRSFRFLKHWEGLSLMSLFVALRKLSNKQQCNPMLGNPVLGNCAIQTNSSLGWWNSGTKRSNTKSLTNIIWCVRSNSNLSDVIDAASQSILKVRRYWCCVEIHLGRFDVTDVESQSIIGSPMLLVLCRNPFGGGPMLVLLRRNMFVEVRCFWCCVEALD